MTTQVALVTGGSRGLGRALTAALHERDWSVVTDGRDAARLHREHRDRQGVVTVPGDLRDRAHRGDLVAAVRRSGGLDLLVNNAGTLGPTPLPLLVDLAPKDLVATFEVNVAVPLALMQATMSLLRPRGVIVNLTSDAAVEGYPGWGGYGASKAALEQVGRVLAVERPDLAVYSFDPGDMRTGMHQQAFPGEDISDRALPEEVAVPALLRLLDRRLASGRYRAEDLLAGVTA